MRFIKAGELLFYYYEASAGLPIESGYYKITLTATTDRRKLQMDVYFRPDGNDEPETKATYLVSSKALKDAMKLVRKHKVTSWNKSQYPCLCGKIQVCKFWHKDKFIRVSSDNMPEYGEAVFSEISSVLSAYIKKRTA